MKPGNAISGRRSKEKQNMRQRLTLITNDHEEKDTVTTMSTSKTPATASQERAELARIKARICRANGRTADAAAHEAYAKQLAKAQGVK
jgi:hypothetical protein